MKRRTNPHAHFVRTVRPTTLAETALVNGLLAKVKAEVEAAEPGEEQIEVFTIGMVAIDQAVKNHRAKPKQEAALAKTIRILSSGHAGVNRQGVLVDCRSCKRATPIPEDHPVFAELDRAMGRTPRPVRIAPVATGDGRPTVSDILARAEVVSITASEEDGLVAPEGMKVVPFPMESGFIPAARKFLVNDQPAEVVSQGDTHLTLRVVEPRPDTPALSGKTSFLFQKH